MIFPVAVRTIRRSAVAVSLGLLVSAAPLIVAELGRAAPSDARASGGEVSTEPDARPKRPKVEPSLGLWLGGIDGSLALGLGADDPPDRNLVGAASPESQTAMAQPTKDGPAPTASEPHARGAGLARAWLDGGGRGHTGPRVRVGAGQPGRGAPDASLASDEDGDLEASPRLVADGRAASDIYLDRPDDPPGGHDGCDASDCARHVRHHPR